MRTSEKIVEYLKKNTEKGYSPETLKQALVKLGYSRGEIEKAFEEFEKVSKQKTEEEKERPKIKYEIYDADYKPIDLNYMNKKKNPWWKKIFR